MAVIIVASVTSVASAFLNFTSTIELVIKGRMLLLTQLQFFPMKLVAVTKATRTLQKLARPTESHMQNTVEFRTHSIQSYENTVVVIAERK